MSSIQAVLPFVAIALFMQEVSNAEDEPDYFMQGLKYGLGYWIASAIVNDI